MDSIKTLIVDNNKLILDLNRELISLSFKDDIKTSSNKEEALELINSFRPDILITDINFNPDEEPCISDLLSIAGVTIARKARIICPFMKIIASSGYRNDDLVFQKILEKDWYDGFHTKGTNGLMDIYSKFRNEALIFKTGLIPKLSKFFAPTNYNWEIGKSIYRLLHTNYDQKDNLKYLNAIIEYYNTFKDMLTEENKILLDNFFKNYANGQITLSMLQEIKEQFYLSLSDLPYSKKFPRKTIYCEKNVIYNIWNKIISESKDNSSIGQTHFFCITDDYNIYLKVTQPNKFDFKKFISSNKTYHLYRSIKSYGNMIIKSENKQLNIKTGIMNKIQESVKGTEIIINLKIIPVNFI